jgi:hypothetical protein
MGGRFVSQIGRPLGRHQHNSHPLPMTRSTTTEQKKGRAHIRAFFSSVYAPVPFCPLLGGFRTVGQAASLPSSRSQDQFQGQAGSLPYEWPRCFESSSRNPSISRSNPCISSNQSKTHPKKTISTHMPNQRCRFLPVRPYCTKNSDDDNNAIATTNDRSNTLDIGIPLNDRCSPLYKREPKTLLSSGTQTRAHVKGGRKPQDGCGA